MRIYICICWAGYAELPAVLLYLLQCLVYHILSKTRGNTGRLHRMIGEVLVLVLLVVVYKIPYRSCMFSTAVVLEPQQDVIGVCCSQKKVPSRRVSM